MLRRVVVLAILACAGPGILHAQKAPPTQKPAQGAVGLSTDGLAGQTIAVLPLTVIFSDSGIPGTSGARARATLLKWADSSFGEVLSERAPEVTWVSPAQLRSAAGRSGGLVPNPDKMGQGVMRSPALKTVPDPLRTYVRQLVALAGGARFALIPAALWIKNAPGDSLRVEFSAVLADARMGRVMWRTLATGTGETLADAYRVALSTILPAEAQGTGHEARGKGSQ